MILLNYGDKMIKGDSGLVGFEEEIQIQKVNWGVGRAVTSSTGDRKFSAPSFSEISLTKGMDKASIDLFVQACGGKDPYDAIMTWVDNSGSSIDIYHQIELGKAIITSYSTSSEGDRPTDSFTLNYKTMLVKYTRYPDSGSPEEISPKGWDLDTGAQL